ncbi:hypothetical protein [Gemmobacter nanjingensis]|uniref:hypothetical protein n=1 Tax=Gemmobacter nanjingensis TaxID=488454 RepID=UPI0016731D04|nr:hypothetical protein [Gemmobacter nanjingensis]
MLKTPEAFRLIGRPVPRLDSAEKCDGSFVYAIDFVLPGMKVAVLARPEVFGASVAGFDDSAARAVPGVHDIFEIPLVRGSAVAVVADGFWTATRARYLLEVTWDMSGVERVDSAELSERYLQLVRSPGKPWLDQGETSAFDRSAADSRIEAEFEFPYLAHGQMEPLGDHDPQ